MGRTVQWMVIDAWMQHPTPRFLAQEMFDVAAALDGRARSRPSELPIDVTLAAMDAAGVEFGLLSAWHGPRAR